MQLSHLSCCIDVGELRCSTDEVFLQTIFCQLYYWYCTEEFPFAKAYAVESALKILYCKISSIFLT